MIVFFVIIIWSVTLEGFARIMALVVVWLVHKVLFGTSGLVLGCMLGGNGCHHNINSIQLLEGV